MARTEFISISKQELRGGLRRVREFISRTATYLRPAVQLVGALLVGRAPLVCKLAARNLFHDRLRFAATITGVVFSMVRKLTNSPICTVTSTIENTTPVMVAANRSRS